MSNPTTNFNWQMPTSTDLVTDLPADFEVFGQAVDTTFVDLKGGTTGQVLSKASNTDMDFSWINADPLTILDAKGDLITATAADTPARLAVGTDNYFLQAASGEATGLKWGGAWSDWTPTLTNITKGNGTTVARYIQIGKVVHFYFRFTMGSTSSMGSAPYFSLPSTPAYAFMATSQIGDYGTTNYIGMSDVSGANVYLAAQYAAATYIYYIFVNSTTPMTWTTNDSIAVWGTYEVA